MNDAVVKIIDVYWEGPKSLEDIKVNKIEGYCLYQIYGTHPIYGPETLLYIGKSEQKNIADRIKNHTWIDNQANDCKIYIATCGTFINWNEWNNDKNKRYDMYDCDKIKISSIESLLIYAHQPSYNSQSLKSPSFGCIPFRLFNSYRRAALLPEVSTQFYKDPTLARNEQES